MKLIKCYISSFGKISDFTYDFSNGLNTITQENGWGKTTIASFIKAMFYGLDGGSKSIAKNERKKYQPWNSKSSFGGYVVFEKSGKTFKLERYFGQKASEDSIILSDFKTGKQFPNTENLGNRIFQIDEDGFLSTTYFSQDDVEIKSNASLTAKYNAICDDDGGEFYTQAIKKLTEKMRSYQTTGNRGQIYDIKREIVSIDEKISQGLYAEKTLSSNKEEISRLENEERKLLTEIDDLSNKLQLASKSEVIKLQKERKQKLLTCRETCQNELVKCNKVLGSSKVDVTVVEGCIDCVRDMEKRQQTAKYIEQNIIASSKTENASKKQGFSQNMFALIFALVFAISSVVCFAISQFIIGGILAGLTLVSLAIWFVFRPNKVQNTDTNSLLEKSKKEYNELVEVITEYKAGIEQFLSQFSFDFELVDYEQTLRMVIDSINKKAQVVQEINDIDNELKEMDTANNDVDFSLVVDYSVEQVTSERKNKEYLLQNVKSRLANLRASIVRIEEIVDSLTDLKAEKERLRTELSDKTAEYEVITHTIKFLEQADEKLKTNYRQPLLEKLNKYYSFITDEDKKVNIDVDFNMSIEEKLGEKVADYYSRGYRDLFEICKRFALLDLLFKDEKPFIVLDDPFCNFDENKIQKALSLLDKLSSEYQIIYLVCHASRVRG